MYTYNDSSYCSPVNYNAVGDALYVCIKVFNSFLCLDEILEFYV